MYSEAIFTLIKDNPGISRQEIFDKLWPNVLQIELTNYLTALRRQGRIENRGIRKYPNWYCIELDELKVESKSKDDLMEVILQSDERLRRSLDHISKLPKYKK